MKLEMGESLIYSWLRHVKACRIVQTNWKPSSVWELQKPDDLKTMFELIDENFKREFNANSLELFKKNADLNQIIKQGECDVIGWTIRNGKNYFYAVEVAFHLGGINYGDKKITTAKVLEKMARAAFCLKGFFDTNEGEIIFASPKIYPSVEQILVPAIDNLQKIFIELDCNFHFKLLHNKSFQEEILKPVLELCSKGAINDTSELFVRSYQLCNLFSDSNEPRRSINATEVPKTFPNNDNPKAVGKLVNEDLRALIESGAISEQELKDMQEVTYSKNNFHCNYPVLSKVRNDSNKSRYYAKPIQVRGEEFFLCNDWYEKPSNDDRPYVIEWLMAHGWQD